MKKIISWNVNGLRAVIKKGYWGWFLEQSPDFFCLQETKCSSDQLPEEILKTPGYYSYFTSHQEKKGYSGVAVFSKEKPEKVEDFMGFKEFDSEGRLLALYFEKFVLINVYFPNGGQGPERLKYKLNFYEKFLEFIEKLNKSGKKIIFCGDVNTAHQEIDLARPKENSDVSGFLPIERKWIDKIIDHGYIDTFRFFHKDKVQYSWWDMKTFARNRNVGWRLDYFFVSKDLEKDLISSDILDKVFGSDHCPVSLYINI